MPICPHCDERIDEIFHAISAEDIHVFDGKESHYLDTVLTGRYEVYYCPNCNEPLAENEEEAKEFFTSK